MEPRKGETIRITIKTVDGDDGEFKVEQSSTIQETTEVAMASFKIEPSQDAAYRLAIKKPDDQFTTLDPAKTLLDEGIKDGDTLWLGTEQVVGSPKCRLRMRRPNARGSPCTPATVDPTPYTWRGRDGRDAVRACI